MTVPKWSKFVMIEKSVVSWPPCCDAVEVKAAPTLPLSAPRIHRPPVSIEKAGHLARHAAKAGWRADDDGVIAGQRIGPLDYRMSGVGLEVRGLDDRRRRRFRHAPDVDCGACRPRTFRDRARHLLDVSVG